MVVHPHMSKRFFKEIVELMIWIKIFQFLGFISPFQLPQWGRALPVGKWEGGCFPKQDQEGKKRYHQATGRLTEIPLWSYICHNNFLTNNHSRSILQ